MVLKVFLMTNSVGYFMELDLCVAYDLWSLGHCLYCALASVAEMDLNVTLPFLLSPPLHDGVLLWTRVMY